MYYATRVECGQEDIEIYRPIALITTGLGLRYIVFFPL
jgi:hypothetical protein